MTPYELEVCLWYYSRAEDWKGMDAPIWPSVRDKLIEMGLIEDSDASWGASYVRTERLNAYINGLLNMPLPIQVWVMPDCPHPTLSQPESNLPKSAFDPYDTIEQQDFIQKGK
jgi:hypothetical protein